MRSLAIFSTGLLVLAAGAIAQMPAVGGPQPAVPPTGMHVILLGTGVPLPNPARAAASTLVVVEGKTFMVDTGWNSLVRLAESGYNDADVVLYTHFHSDHYDGLGQLFMNRGVAGATEPLRVLGPNGTREIVDGIIASIRVDVGYRKAHHGDKWSDNAVAADVSEFDEGIIYDEGGLTITMFAVEHHPVEPAVGYRFDFDGKSVVISGDTIKSERLIEAARDCDVLVHEAMDAQMLEAVVPMLQRTDPRRAEMLVELMDYHTSTIEVAEIARDANVKKLVLTHLVPSIPPLEGPETNFIRGMAAIYDGPIVVGRDNMVITVD